MSDDDQWRPLEVVGGDGETDAAGVVELATGTESRPCAMCRSWENVDQNKLIRHIMAHGLKPNERGNFTTPIAKDFVGRKSLELDPKSSGFCRRDSIITDMLATCENWQPTISLSDFQQRMRRR